MQLIKSPLNYTGNKYRIMDQIRKYFPENIECMIDLFCGGATVGLNTNAKKVIFVDSNERIVNLLIFLSKQDFDGFIKECENVIDKYGLSYSFSGLYLRPNDGIKISHNLHNTIALRKYSVERLSFAARAYTLASVGRLQRCPCRL